jgi:hypothetical protein
VTIQQFNEFKANVEETAESFENLAEGITIITCEDGVRILVLGDDSSELMAMPPIMSKKGTGEAA